LTWITHNPTFTVDPQRDCVVDANAAVKRLCELTAENSQAPVRHPEACADRAVI